MRKLLILLTISVLFSCKKNHDNESAAPVPILKLQSIAITNPANSDLQTTTLEYDSLNRIIKVNKTANGIVKKLANINYANDQITLKFQDNEAKLDEVKYTVNANGQPLKRIRYYAIETPQFQKSTVVFDTTIYEYGKNQLLNSTSNMRKDSSFILAGVGQTEKVVFSTTTTQYTNVGNNLKSIFSKERSTSVYKTSSVTTISNWGIEKNISYDYSKNFPNKMDHTNAIVLNEAVYFYFVGYPLSKDYTNLPDSMTYSNTYIDQNGIRNTSGNLTDHSKLIFNSDGYVSTVEGLINVYSCCGIANFNYIKK